MSFKYTAEQFALLRVWYSSMSVSELTPAFNAKFGTDRTQQQIKTYVHNHGIRSGRTGCFEKGSKPWNTGTKGLTKPNTGNFKKGGIPGNLKPLGAERICSKDGFVLVKIAEKNPYTEALTRYKHKHIVVWEQTHGPAPEGMVIAFRDGDKMNCDINNLMLISRAELLRLNQYNYKEAPEELKPSLLALTKLEVKVFGARRQRGINEHQMS